MSNQKWPKRVGTRAEERALWAAHDALMNWIGEHQAAVNALDDETLATLLYVAAQVSPLHQYLRRWQHTANKIRLDTLHERYDFLGIGRPRHGIGPISVYLCPNEEVMEVWVGPDNRYWGKPVDASPDVPPAHVDLTAL